MTIRVGVVGAAGRMGRTVCRAVHDDPSLELVAAVDRTDLDADVGGLIGAEALGVTVAGSLEGLLEAGAEVAVDFTHPSTVMEDVRWAVANGVHLVVGTTGFTEADLDEARRLLDERGPGSNVFIAPNFALGAVLMVRFAEEAARHLPAAEVVELHHDGKADAPSGTAASTARRIAAARREVFAPKVESTESVEGVRGGTVDGIPVHSVRLPGFVAHQEVIFGGQGQTLTIRHDSTDRTSFMPGVLMAVKAVADRPGLTVGLDALLD
jgi:4-hydroxy-tetrahydrodipicolinate reductase